MKNIKNKIGNKGFTLIELLVVVVILLAISVMAVSSISAAIERNKAKQDSAKIDLIVSYAELYFDGHKNELINSTGKGGISVDMLYQEYDFSDDDKKNASGSIIGGIVCYSFDYDNDPRGNKATFVYDSDGSC